MATGGVPAGYIWVAIEVARTPAIELVRWPRQFHSEISDPPPRGPVPGFARPSQTSARQPVSRERQKQVGFCIGAPLQ